MITLLAGRVFAEEMPIVTDQGMGESLYSKGEAKIPGLIWKGANNQPSFTIEDLKGGKPAARVEGRFESRNAGTLIFSSSVLQRAQYKDDTGNFTALIPLTARVTPVKVQYIDDYGNKQSQDIEIVYEKFDQHGVKTAPKTPWNFDGGASFSLLDYTQTAQANGATTKLKVTQVGLTPKFGVTYRLSEKFDLGTSAFGTLIGVPMKKEPDGLSTPRFYGINARVGYRLYSAETANIYLMTGAYFWGMLVPASVIDYGVIKLSGPQLFLVGRFLTGQGRTAVGYLKLATITDGVGSMTKNREFAFGGAYQLSHPTAPRRIMVNLDLASANFYVQPAPTPTDPAPPVNNIRLNSVSLGLSTTL